MATKGNPGDNRSGNLVSIFIAAGLCCFFYVLGAWSRSGSVKGDNIALEIIKKAGDCSILSNLEFESHHGEEVGSSGNSTLDVIEFEPCDDRYTDYTPCQEQMRAMTFPRENMNYRERHCPPEDEKLNCLIPAPKGYITPFRWPKSRDHVPYANVPHKSLTVEKAVQNWVQYEGDVFRFPGGGTQFPHGADAYIEQLASVIPINNGTVRTALDTGCGVASWGAYLFKKNVITMSFAPRDSHEAQVQFALERGIPAIIGVLGTIKLPYPPRAFDVAHCSRCLIQWSGNDGIYLKEVDRVLRPGGYWILSGPPINWRNNYEAWERSKEELENEQKNIEETTQLLCWKKIYEKNEIAIWRKSINDQKCGDRDDHVSLCKPSYVHDVWDKKMEACVTPYPETSSSDEVAGGELQAFPDRLRAIPPRVGGGNIPGISADIFQEDAKMWQKHVNAYKRTNKILYSERYRNVMDMNAGLAGFAAALESPNLWVMNVVPTIAQKDTLGAIYERGLIGIYHDWCEAFSTYPRTYDLIHASGIFSLYDDKCKMEDILLEMDRILRPEGTAIIRDDADVLTRVKRIVSGMRWKTKMVDNEDGPLISEKILFAVKQYWVAGGNSVASQGTRLESNSSYKK